MPYPPVASKIVVTRRSSGHTTHVNLCEETRWYPPQSALSCVRTAVRLSTPLRQCHDVANNVSLDFRLTEALRRRSRDNNIAECLQGRRRGNPREACPSYHDTVQQQWEYDSAVVRVTAVGHRGLHITNRPCVGFDRIALRL